MADTDLSNGGHAKRAGVGEAEGEGEAVPRVLDGESSMFISGGFVAMLGVMLRLWMQLNRLQRVCQLRVCLYVVLHSGLPTKDDHNVPAAENDLRER